MKPLAGNQPNIGVPTTKRMTEFRRTRTTTVGSSVKKSTQQSTSTQGRETMPAQKSGVPTATGAGTLQKGPGAETSGRSGSTSWKTGNTKTHSNK